MKKLTHMDERGRARMVDIGRKKPTARTAIAAGKVFLGAQGRRAILDSKLPKGNPFEVARLAGIQAAKRTSRLIPLCHDLNLDFADVEIGLEEEGFHIRAEVRCRQATGVEMEALTAVAVSALTLYDMCKAVDKEMVIGEVRLVEKRKGKN